MDTHSTKKNAKSPLELHRREKLPDICRCFDNKNFIIYEGDSRYYGVHQANKKDENPVGKRREDRDNKDNKEASTVSDNKDNSQNSQNDNNQNDRSRNANNQNDNSRNIKSGKCLLFESATIEETGSSGGESMNKRRRESRRGKEKKVKTQLKQVKQRERRRRKRKRRIHKDQMAMLRYRRRRMGRRKTWRNTWYQIYMWRVKRVKIRLLVGRAV
jgi:hypothetical protein